MNLEKKTVALVGPSPDVRGKHDIIEGHDVVVRMNRSLPVTSPCVADVGRRTDIWVTCFAGNLRVDSGDLIQGFRNRLDMCGDHLPSLIVVWSTESEPRIRNEWPGFKEAVRPYGIPIEMMSMNLHIRLAKELGTNPSTGVLTLGWLLEQPLAGLDIFGMSFFATGYREGIIETLSEGVNSPRPSIRPPDNHHPTKERVWFQDLMSRDSRVNPDEAMSFLTEHGLEEEVKYRHIHSHQTNYGDSNRGKDFLPDMLKHGMTSVVDIGCGHNMFVKGLPERVRGVGLDVACSAADIICDAADTPFEDGEFDYVSAFDFLEHVAPTKVNVVLAEMRRISNRFILLVSFKKDTHFKVAGMGLHPSAESLEWWADRLQKEAEEMDITAKEDWGVFHGEWS